jgi:hypothetical protein
VARPEVQTVQGQGSGEARLSRLWWVREGEEPRMIPWECRYKCGMPGSKGKAESYKEARLAKRLHEDVGKLTAPEKHGRNR